MRTGMILTIILWIILNLFVLGGHGGRGSDYYENQQSADMQDE